MPACLAGARSIHRRTDGIVLTATARGAIYPVGSQRAWGRTVDAFESWGTGALPGHTVTVGPILAAADLLARVPVESRRACLIAVEARPARLTGTLSRHGVTAVSVVQVAGAPPVALHAVQAVWTQARLAELAGEACLAEARAAHVIALPAVEAPAGLGTPKSIGPNRTLILAPFSCVSWTAVTLACGDITRPSIMALTFLGTVLSKATLGARLTTHCAHPARRARALPGDMVTHSSVLAGASLLTLWTVLAGGTEVFTEGSGVSWRAATLPCDMVAGGSVLALASLVTVVTVGALLTAVLAAPASEACRTVAGARDGVAQSPVFALAPAAAVGAPVISVAGTGAVGPTPARLTLTGVWSNAATVDTFISTVRDTHLPAFVKSRTTLGFAPIHGFLPVSIGCPVTNSVSRAFKPVEDVSAASVVDLIKRMWVGLLHRH